MKKQQLLFTNQVDTTITQLCAEIPHDRLFVLCDTTVASKVLPLLQSPLLQNASRITIETGDEQKSLATLSQVWQQLSQGGATRHSLLLNIGGGMVTDLGGFAAATFKRGITFINIPTTLLGAVDAAIGGKTGINFNGLKNEIGAFAPAHTVIISTRFFDTLSRKELLSGYAEMIKHSLLDSAEAYDTLLNRNITACDKDTLLPLLQKSVSVKERIIEADPKEKGIRKALNLGHTIGHAFESHALHHNRPIPHGYAVAWGIVCELLLAHRTLDFPTTIIYDLAHYIEQYYGSYAITCDDYNELYDYMTHDKKNEQGHINFTLLRQIGQPIINCHVERKEIEVSLDIYRDLFHL